FMSAKRIASRTLNSVTTTIRSTAAVFHALRRNRSERKRVLSCSKRIAAPPDGLDDRAFVALIQFTPQAIDVHFDHVGGPFPVGLPEVFRKHSPGHDVPRVTHQDFQEAEFRRREVDFTAVARDASRGEVQRQWTRL